MLIDDIYKEVQSLLNKDQLGYLRPLDFNKYLASSQIKIFNNIFSDLKTNVRKSNWHLDGKDFASFSERQRQLIEYFAKETPTELEEPYNLPIDLEFISDVYSGDNTVEKVSYSDFLKLKKNIYAKPTICSPICSKVGDNLKVFPNVKVHIHYIRLPKTPKWTYYEYQDKPFFDETADDFQDVDMPKSFQDDLVSLVAEKSSIALRDFQVTQSMNTEQQQDIQQDNKQ